VRRPLGRALVRAIPAWAWLTGLVVVSTLVRYALGRHVVAPWIMVDELIYSEQAKSFADSGQLLVRDRPTGGYGPVYPILASPAYALFESLPDAYAAVKAINAFLMSLAAIPAYFLARRVLERPLALVGALLAVALPSLVYTGNVMTESAFYPLFLAAALALVLVLERPSAPRVAVLAVATLAALLTRTQALAILPALVSAALVLGWRRYRWLLGLVAGGALVMLGVQLGRGRSLTDLLGAYKVTSEEHYTVGAVAKWLLWHVAELDLYLGVVPFAALLALALRGRGLPRELQVFTAAAVSLAAWLLLEVSAFASIPSVTRIEERYTFYLAPLFLIALLVWIERGLPRDRRTAVAAALSGLLVVVLPFNDLIGTESVSDTLQLLPWWRIHDAVTDDIRVVATLCACAAAAVFLFLPRRYALVLPALVLVYFAVTTSPIEARIRQASLGSLFAGVTVDRDWIDKAVPKGQEVVALHSGAEGSFAIWENEFFNRRVGRVLYLHAPTGGNLPETKVVPDANGVFPVRARWVLTDSSVELAGKVVGRDDRRGMLLLRVDGPVRTTTRVTGLYPSDTWSGRRATYTRLRCSGGSVTAFLQGDPSLFERPQTVTARVGGQVVARTKVAVAGETPLRVPLRARGGRCTVVFAVSPTAVPGPKDTRVLGVHFNRFAYRP
jgi:hypothetical protein